MGAPLSAHKAGLRDLTKVQVPAYYVIVESALKQSISDKERTVYGHSSAGMPMGLDAITPNNLRSALQSLQQGKKLPDALLSLTLLHFQGEISSTEKELRLAKLLSETVKKSLEQSRNHLRMQVGDEQKSAACLAADFRPGDVELESWSALYYRFFADEPNPTEKLAKIACIHERQFRRRVESGLDYLVKTLQQQELEAEAAQHKNRLSHYLPSSESSQLFGIDSLREQTVSWLTDPQGPPFVSIEGLGGIGKSALAQNVAQYMARYTDLEEILWISARQEWFSTKGETTPVDSAVRSLDDIVARLASQLGQEQLAGLATQAKVDALTSLLTQHPHLIVLDNLETLDDVQMIVPALHPLAGATRFLLTSRHTLQSFPYVQVYRMPELSLCDSRALLEGWTRQD